MPSDFSEKSLKDIILLSFIITVLDDVFIPATIMISEERSNLRCVIFASAKYKVNVWLGCTKCHPFHIIINFIIFGMWEMEVHFLY